MFKKPGCVKGRVVYLYRAMIGFFDLIGIWSSRGIRDHRAEVRGERT
jgi:hypothetical protein